MTRLIRVTGRRVGLPEAKAIVGGGVAVHPLRYGQKLLVNEDALNQGLPINAEATALVGYKVAGDAAVVDGWLGWK